jgi:small GTP-binding protein
MSLSIGIVGLPNAGKSTLFNALVRGHQAKVADYPFTTIEPNVGMVEVPDERLNQIADLIANPKSEILNPKQIQNSKSEIRNIKKIPATIKFIDIAGLVKNAHQGEGLGNQFLGHIREVDAIIHVLDGFSGQVDPEEAKEIVKMELELAGIKKPMLIVQNISEKDILNKSKIRNPKSEIQEDTIYLSAKMEEELTDLADNEAKQYLESFGLGQSGLVRLIQESYKLLNLITFYTLKLTTGNQQLTTQQVQAWPILKGTKAPQAAGKIHTDMERGFIAADVCHYLELIAAGGWQEAKEKGKLRTEGKDYLIQDGDIIHFKFNV